MLSALGMIMPDMTAAQAAWQKLESPAGDATYFGRGACQAVACQ